MFTNVLVPLDGSAVAAAALPFARTLARAVGAELTLLRVVPTLDPQRPPREQDLTDAHAYLSVVARELAAENLRVETMVRAGGIASEILTAIAARGADVVVMATHAPGGIDRAVFGSFAESVLHDSPVPVVVVPLQAGERPSPAIGTLLVPVDGSPGGALSLGAAVGLARATDARVLVLRVVEPGSIHLRAHLVPAPVVSAGGAAVEEAARAAAQSDVEELVARLREAGVTAEGRVRVGRPAPQIVACAEAEAADAIVMSTRARRGLERALLGSVADEVVRTAHRPIMLFRPVAATQSQAGQADCPEDPPSAAASRE